MNAKYYKAIVFLRFLASIKRRITLPFYLFSSKFIYTDSYFPEMKRKSRIRILGELLMHIYRFGYIESHYFSYGFDIKGFRNRNDYLDESWFLWKSGVLNTILVDHDYTCILQDKSVFSSLLNNWGFKTPQTISVVKTNEEAQDITNKLLCEGGTYFCKPIDGLCGRGAFSLCISEHNVAINDVEIPQPKAIKTIMDFFSNGHYIIQTHIQQHPDISRVYDKSINTLRILTIIDKASGKPVPVAGEVRFGANGSTIDNFDAGGIVVGIDLKTGRLFDYGYCKKGSIKRTPYHPDTHIYFSSIQLPFFDEALKQIEQLHSNLSSIRIAGWDIAITTNGPLFIEGNDRPGLSGLQTVNGGLKHVINSLL